MHRCLSSSLLRRGDGAAWSTALCAVASRLPLLPAVACRRASGAGGGGGGGGGGNYRPGGARGESAGGFTFPAGDAGDGGDAELLDDGDEENEEGAEDELEFDSDVDEPAVVAARNSKIRAATCMEWDARVPGDYRALSEARAYEATLAAAADSRLEDMEASDLPPATGPLPISRGGRGGAAGASSKAQPRRGSELLLRSGPRLSGADATEELLNNLHASPDALDRVQLSSADARITSLDADPYSWPARHSKEAPRWMLYEAQREEVSAGWVRGRGSCRGRGLLWVPACGCVPASLSLHAACAPTLLSPTLPHPPSLRCAWWTARRMRTRSALRRRRPCAPPCAMR